MKRELKAKTAKRVFLEGVLAIFLAALLLTFVISSISEYDFDISQYAIVYLISVLTSMTMVTMLLFIITCIESLVIMMIDKKFNMRNLLFVNYNFFGKNILLSSLLVLVIINFDNATVKMTAIIVTYVIAVLLMAGYYFNIVRVASVNKNAGRVLISIIGVLVVAINGAALI